MQRLHCTFSEMNSCILLQKEILNENFNSAIRRTRCWLADGHTAADINRHAAGVQNYSQLMAWMPQKLGLW